ncbi:MAG: 50S ribosomal protein L27 [bacterium]
MAHTKAQGAANRHVNMSGKRLGLKKAAGEFTKAGSIILRQRGSTCHPGINASMGRDYTIFALKDGFLSFRQMTGHHRGQKFIDILPEIKIKTKAVAKKPHIKSSPKPVSKVKAVKKAL